jgi:hypothetical protein
MTKLSEFGFAGLMDCRINPRPTIDLAIRAGKNP